MKTHCLRFLLLAWFAVALGAQNASPPARGPNTPQPAAPPNMGNLAVHFKGTLNTNVPLDVTVNAQGSDAKDALMDIRVVAVDQSDDGYVVNYVAHYNIPTSLGGNRLFPVGASGRIFLKLGQPVQVAKCADTDVTLALTELAQ